MGAASNYSSAAGLFATSQRGGLTPAEIREIEAHRAKERPTPWQALAVRYGRCEADIKALFQAPANDDRGAIEAEGAKPVDPRDERFRSMWASGARCAVICRELRISRATLWNIRVRLALPPRQIREGSL